MYQRNRHGGQAFTLIELLTVATIVSILAALLMPVLSRAREAGRRSVCLSNQRQIGEAIFLYAQDYDQHYPPAKAPDYPWTFASKPYLKGDDVLRCPSWQAPPRVMGPVFRLNGDRIPHLVSYAYNQNIGGIWNPPDAHRPDFRAVNKTLSEVVRPSQTILLSDAGATAEAGKPPSVWREKVYDCLSTVVLADATVAGTFEPTASGPSAPSARHHEATNVLFADGHVKWIRVETFYTPPGQPSGSDKPDGYSPCLDPQAGCP